MSSISRKESRINKVWTSKVIYGLVLILTLMLCRCSETDKSLVKENLSKIVIGYYASWTKAEFDHTKIQYKYLTHIAHAFTKPDSDGNLIVADDYVYPELIQTAHLNNVKVIMSIGGWGNCEGFPGMASMSKNRKRFIHQVLKFCRDHEYDGVDIDWEYVSNPEEQKNFVTFIKELSMAMKAQNPPLLLTMAAPSGAFWGRWVNYEQVVDHFDYISCMTYDYHGEWTDHSGHNSPLYTCGNDPCGSVDGSYAYFLIRKVPPQKLLLGIPFYGRSFDSRDLYQEYKKSQSYGYSEILNLINSGWSPFWDDCSQVPYLRNQDETEIVSYDDERSLSLKCRYVEEKQVAGLIIWELSLDHYQNDSVLLKVIGEEFKKSVPSLED